ncbi:MAG: AgmX/PglI C-terminal domain-containing protein [Deltaproteobacteria bacterium]|nr:AgmX/PglI C-terminal domain-containing protein [Deltaproteobacteria bacterium]
MEQSSRPSRVAAGIAAALPIVSGIAAFLVLLVAATGPSGLGRMIEEAGGAAFLVFLTAILGMVAAAVLLVLLGLGMRIPIVLVVGAAALPWIAGALGMMLGMVRVDEAISFAAPEMRARLMAQGLAEATNSRVLGSVFGGAILAATAIGLGVVSIGQSAPRRSPIGAIVGAGSALLFLVAAAVAIALGETGFVGAILVLPSIGAIVALGLAGAGAGADEPHGRAAALAAAAPIAAGLAFVAGAAATSTIATIHVLSAVAGVDPGSRGGLVAMAAAEVAPVTALERWGAVLAVVPALALAAWAFSRARPSAGRIAGAVALALAAALVVGLDSWAIGSAGESLAHASAPSWSEVEGFQPIALDGDDGETTAKAVVGVDDVAPRGGQPIAVASVVTPGGAAALTAAFTALLREPGPSDPFAVEERGPPDVEGHMGERQAGEEGSMGRGDAQKSPSRYGIRGPADSPDPELARQSARESVRRALSDPIGLPPSTDLFGPASPPQTPALALAVDARVNAATLAAILRAAQTAGARSVRVIGTASSETDPARARETVSSVPLLAPLAVAPRSRLVLLGGSLPEGWADRDERLLHATVAGPGPLRLEPRAGAGDPVLVAPRSPGSPSRRFGEEPIHPSVAYLSIGPGASAATFFDAADRVAVAGLLPLVVLGPTTPGHPERPVDGLARIGQMGPGTTSEDGIGTEIEVPIRGSARVVRLEETGGDGTLDAREVRRVLELRTASIRACYERELRINPTLRGSITVGFAIGASGAVARARADGMSPVVASCLASMVTRYRFPPPEGGSVEYVLEVALEPSETGFGAGGGGTGAGTIGLGNLGTIGHGGGGGGYRSSEDPRERGTARITQGRPTVRGSLSAQVVEMVVRRHTNELRFCYEEELARSPDLAGRLIVNFVISAAGSVQSVTLAGSTLGDAAVEVCVARAFQRWVFPQPEAGGTVIVSFPLLFSRDG